MLGSLDFYCYTGNIVKSGFYSIQLTVTFAGTQKVDRYVGNIVKSTIVKSGFHCSGFGNTVKPVLNGHPWGMAN